MMIVLNDEYSITADGNGYALVKKSTGIRSADKEGKWKKGDKYENSENRGYSGTLAGIFKIYLKDATRAKVAKDEIMQLDKFIKWFEKFKTDVNNKFDLL